MRNSVEQRTISTHAGEDRHFPMLALSPALSLTRLILVLPIIISISLLLRSG